MSIACRQQPMQAARLNGHHLQPDDLHPNDIKVLLVDDEQLSRCVVGNLLRKCGYMVTVCDSGANALDILKRSAPGTFQLILTDVMMPEVDGLDILRYVRSNILLADLPVIMMSANEQKDTVFQAIAQGAEEYLVKPVTKKEVQNIWQYVWKRWSASQLPRPCSQVELQALQAGPAIEETATAPPAAAALAVANLQAEQQQPKAQQQEVLNSMQQLHRQQQQVVLQQPHPQLPAAGGNGSTPAISSCVPLSQWLQRTQRTFNAKASTWLFCEVLLLLQQLLAAADASTAADAMQARSAAAAGLLAAIVRPSKLLLHSNGRVTLATSAGAAAAGDVQEAAVYQSPEEEAGAAASMHSSSNSSSRSAAAAGHSVSYSLGMLFLDLLYVPPADGSRMRVLADARRRVLPAGIVQKHPAEANLILSLLHPDPAVRPSVADLLAGQLLSGCCAALQERHRQQQQQQQQPPLQQALKQPCSQQQQQQQQQQEKDAESLVFFLQTLNDKKLSEVHQVQRDVADLDSQIAAVESALRLLQQQQQQQLLPFGSNTGSPVLDSVGGLSCLPQAETAVQAPLLPRIGSSTGGLADAASGSGGFTEQQQQQQKRRGAGDSDDEDDLEMERRELSRRKRQRVQPSTVAAGPSRDSQQQQQQMLSLTRLGSANSGVVANVMDRSPPPAAAAAAAAAAAGAADDHPPEPGVENDAALAAVPAAVSAKWKNVLDRFPVLDTVYSKHKQRWLQRRQQQQQVQHPGPEQSAAGAPAASGGSSGGSAQMPGYLAAFEDDLWSYSRFSRLAVRGTVRAAADVLGGGSAMVCSAAFDRDDEYVATAGVSKRIRIFEYAAITSSACGGSGGCATGTAAANGMGGYSHCHAGGGGAGGGAAAGGSTAVAGGGGVAAGCDGIVYPVLELSSRSRLSCVVWSSYVKAQVASSDYEGVVQLWDANTGGELMQFEEHAKRAWAVDFSRLEPTRLVSSSDDGTIKLWSIHQDTSVATLQLHANVCSVQFSPDNSHLLAAGCANYRLYLYDLRKTGHPLSCVPGHKKAVSYVRWLTGDQLVSASTDSTVKLWSVPALVAAGSSTVGSSAAAAASGREAAAAACLSTYSGHANERNFIGLAVLPGVPGASCGGSSSGGGGGSSSMYAGNGRDAAAVPASGYIVCGSETNEVYAYHTSMPVPITSHHFSAASHSSGRGWQRGGGGSPAWGDLDDWGDGAHGSDKQFVSCVAWNKRAGTIVAANSAGHVKVLELV